MSLSVKRSTDVRYVFGVAILLAAVQPVHARDLDRDGMSDVWQRVHNIATGDTANDIDQDGHSNIREAEAGTDPRNRDDFFRTFGFSVSSPQGAVTLSWRSVEQRDYGVEKSLDLTTWGIAKNATGDSGLSTTATLSIVSPPNDLFARRAPASTSTTQTTGSNVDASAESGEPRNPSAAGGKSVWWSWSSSTSGAVTITTVGSNFDTTLAVYSGSALPNLVLLGANDDTSGTQSSVTFTAQAGVSYSIQVDGFSSNTGSIVLNHPISSGVLPPPNIAPNIPPKMFFRVRGYPENDPDSDQDSLLNWEERLLGTDLFAKDSDNDEMGDAFEFDYQLNPLSAADALTDADGDLLTNVQDSKLGLSPRSTDTNGNGTSDANEDQDLDGLTNLAELQTHGTDPTQPDTEGDGLSDGWEILYGYSALINNETDADTANDPDADSDQDDLKNALENQIGTNPNKKDTDEDGIIDPVEAQGGSDPTNPASTPANPGGTPGGPVTPPPPTIPVEVNFGDHSGSHSEKYRVCLEPLEGDANTEKRFRTNSKYGQIQTETFHLPAGAKYKVTLTHIGTDPNYNGDPKPDYDYTLKFISGSTDTAIKAIPEDTAGMLGVHDESENFFADGKDAALYIAWLTSKTVATLPTDQKRKKLGVGEEVNLTLKPTSLPSPTWNLSGGVGTSGLNPIAGVSSKITAGERACTPSTEATILGEKVKIDFNVIEPTGATMKRETGTGIWHIQGLPSAGFIGRPFIKPTDVSFIEIQVREGQCNAIGNGYYGYLHGKLHPDGAWVDVVTGDVGDPSKIDGIDTIQSGTAPDDAGHSIPDLGTFDWPIPWLFRVGSGGEKQFTTVTHHHESDAAGTVTISKGGVSVSATINAPTVR